MVKELISCTFLFFFYYFLQFHFSIIHSVVHSICSAAFEFYNILPWNLFKPRDLFFIPVAAIVVVVTCWIVNSLTFEMILMMANEWLTDRRFWMDETDFVANVWWEGNFRCFNKSICQFGIIFLIRKCFLIFM